MASSNTAVKCVNTAYGRKRFVCFSQSVEEISIDVSLEPVKSEPSTGSSFFRASLIQWRELNTAEDFISFYEEMMPLVQTLPQIILHREKIFSKLLDRLNMRARLSLEPILDFLERLTKSIVDLLEEGGEREPEILKQVFNFWARIITYLQKYLVKDIINILKVTVQLRFFRRYYVRYQMAEAVALLLRNAPENQLITGLKKVVREVAKRSSLVRKHGCTFLLWHAMMRGTSGRLHSKAKKVLRCLLDKSTLCLNEKYPLGSGGVVEVITGVLNRLCTKVDQQDLDLIYTCLYDAIESSMKSDCLEHLNYIIGLLSFVIQTTHRSKSLDKKEILRLVQLLLNKFFPSDGMEMEKQLCEVVDSLLNFLLCLLDVPIVTSDLVGILSVHASVFQLRTPSFLYFIQELITKDAQILHAFQSQIISAMANFVESSPDQVTFILLRYFEREPLLLERTKSEAEDSIKKLCDFFNGKLCYWTKIFNNLSGVQVREEEAALLWGVITCYLRLCDSRDDLVIVRNLISGLDQLLRTEDGVIASLPRATWQSLIGAALKSYHALVLAHNQGNVEVYLYLSLAQRQKSSPQVLLAVAEFFDSLLGERYTKDEINAETKVNVLVSFIDNLSSSNKTIRVSTLRICSHFFPRDEHLFANDERPNKRLKTEESDLAKEDAKNTYVVELLLSIETTPCPILTSKITNFISRMQMNISAGKIRDEYLQLVLHGLLGLLHYIFSQALHRKKECLSVHMECLSVLIRNHRDAVWEKFVEYLAVWQNKILSHADQLRRHVDGVESLDIANLFNQFLYRESDPTPSAAVMVLLLQFLQKIPDIAESQSRQLIPLFFNFLGYTDDNIASVESHTSHRCKGKDWRDILKEWLNVINSMHNTPSLYRSNALHKVLIERLLDDMNPEIQVKVLDCLLKWKEELLVLYAPHLQNLAVSKNLREELTTWSVSKESNSIEEEHRSCLVPLIIRLLTPKVRMSRKHTGVDRKALIRFFMQFEPSELELFFSLLLKPLLPQPLLIKIFDSRKSLCSVLPEVSSSIALDILSGKRTSGFLHVVEDVFVTFDMVHIEPFLDPLLMIVVLTLERCMRNIKGETGEGGDTMAVDNRSNDLKGKASTEHFKKLRTLCLRILSLGLNKFENHNFWSEFWGLFFTSVRPLVDRFKLEGASSEKPRPLFLCFIVMSKSPKLVSLLARQPNLVPTIFSILSVRTASDAIVSAVLEFIENLLRLDSDLDLDEREVNPVKEVLLPHVDVLVQSLHDLYKIRSEFQRRSVVLTGRRELRVFKMLAKYVKDSLIAGKFLDVLRPLFRKKSISSDECLEGLELVREMIPILSSESYDRVLGAVNPLLVSAALELRLGICEVVDGLALYDSSFTVLARLLRHLNAVSTSELGELDYDTRIKAYDSVEPQLFLNLREEQTMAVLYHCVYDMSSDDLIFRQSASRALQTFLEFAAPILNGDVSTTGDEGTPVVWKKASVMQIVDRIYFHHMGDAMCKDMSVQKEWFALLREMVYNFRNQPSLSSFRSLCSEDPDHDLFANIVHLQIYRRAKALSLFRKKIVTSNFSEAVTMKIFVPLLFTMLFDVREIKGEHLKNACVETLASIGAHIQWESYHAILSRCFRELTIKSDKQKILLRLICAVLDSFHFFDDSVMTEKVAEENKRHYLKEKLSSLDSEKVNVNTSLVALKILKLLPVETVESHLPRIVKKICASLKNRRLQSIRDEARSLLAACLKELGIECLPSVVQSLRTNLKQGYKLHVLGYTLNFLLSKSVSLAGGDRVGQLDYCLEELLEVVKTDIFGDVSEEKEVDKIAFKMKETKKSMSYETLRLVANNVTFRTQAPRLLSPVSACLMSHLTPKMKQRIEMALHNIALGIESNPSTKTPELFIFVWGLVHNTIEEGESKTYIGTETSILNLNSNPNSHLITDFGLELLRNRLKRTKLDKNDEKLLSMLDPFIPLLTQCLNSKYESVISSSFKCLTQLISLPLPSLELNANQIKISLLEICCRSNYSTSPLMQSCLRLLSVLLNGSRVRVTLSDKELVNIPVFKILQTNPSPVALSLLKAIVGRKFVVPKIGDMVTRVRELMVTSQAKPQRIQCSQILLQFLLDYPLPEEQLGQHLKFLLDNLSYEHPSGREAVLEMLHAILVKFPKSVVDSQAHTFFIRLVLALSNEKDPQIHAMIATIIKELIDHTSESVLNSIMECCISWYSGDNHNLWSAAAQVLGLLAETPKTGFRKHRETVIRVAKLIMETQVSSTNETGSPSWKEAYHSLALLEKVFVQFPEMYFKRDLEDVWILVTKFLLHPYSCLRDISTRLVASYFASVPEAEGKDNKKKSKTSNNQSFILVSPSRLFVISVSLINQLRTELERGAEMNGLILENISFSVCRLHSFATERKLDRFWSGLNPAEQSSLLEGFESLGSRKVKNSFLLSATTSSGAEMDTQSKISEEDLRFLLVVPLIKRMGKIAMQMGDVQMEIVFKSFGIIAMRLGQEESLAYAHHILFPLYKVSEGFAGKVISDNIKQIAGEVRDRIRDVIGVDNFVQVYNQIRKSLKRKRESRKQSEKVLAVVNPIRHAKRKILIAAKHRAHKRRKIMNMKMGQWGR